MMTPKTWRTSWKHPQTDCWNKPFYTSPISCWSYWTTHWQGTSTSLPTRGCKAVPAIKNQQQNSQLLNKLSEIPHPKLKSITMKLGYLIDVSNTIFPSTFKVILTLPTKKVGPFGLLGFLVGERNFLQSTFDARKVTQPRTVLASFKNPPISWIVKIPQTR